MPESLFRGFPGLLVRDFDRYFALVFCPGILPWYFDLVIARYFPGLGWPGRPVRGVAGPGSEVLVAHVDGVAGIDFDVPYLLIAEGVQGEVEDALVEVVLCVLKCKVLDEGLGVC